MNDRRSILVVEDEAIVAEALSRRLRADGWDVVGTAGSGPRALELCSLEEPDVVLLDIRLKGNIDGIEVATGLGGEDPPAVVFLTAHSDAATLARAKLAQPAGYLLKPFSDAQLRVTLETAYHLRQVRSAQRRAERQREVLDTRLRALLRHAPDPILALGSEGVAFHSESAVNALGYQEAPERLAAARMPDLLDVGGLGEVTADTIAEASDAGLLAGLRMDGSRFEARATAAHIDGTDLTALILRDVTAERAMERQVRDAQRMEAVGRVTAAVAHDFNNVLSLIKGYAVLVRDTQVDPTAREDLGEILAAVDHGAALARKLLVYAKEERLGRVAELNEVVRSVARLLTRLLPPSVEVRLQLDDDLPTVQMARTALEQVLLNLALNARDAMPEGGVLRLETQALGADWVQLRVADTGTGMDEATLAQVFEPFFTTKPLGRGTGLGMTIVRAALREVGGSVALESEPDVGTQITLHLPSGIAVQPDSLSGATDEMPDLADKVVLVVDDEPGIRSVVVRTLQDCARDVLVASSGIEALKIAEDNHVDVLIADLVLPDIPGHAVARRMLSSRPALDVLVISGYPTLDSHGTEGRFKALAKPFGPDQLLAALRD